VEQGLTEGVLFNVTQDTVLRFLPPFLLEEKHVDRGIRVLKKLLGKKRKKAQSQVPAASNTANLG
jgi:acetylornithine/succinyldiaminopimelate/putrescine aminotransferase